MLRPTACTQGMESALADGQEDRARSQIEFFSFFIFQCTGVLPACVTGYHVHAMTAEDERWCQTPWNQSCKRFLATM